MSFPHVYDMENGCVEALAPLAHHLLRARRTFSSPGMWPMSVVGLIPDS
jgi:hypothetical protein